MSVRSRKFDYVTPSDRHDGLGIRLLQTMSTMLYARMCRKTYVHSPLCNLDHGVSNEEAERFFNLGDGEIPRETVTEKVKSMAWINANPHRWNMIIPSVRAKYQKAPKSCWYDRSEINVAIHVRRGDVTPKQNRNRYTYNEDILFIQQQIAALRGPFKFHLFSVGKPEDFAEFEGVQLHLDEDPLEAFHHMVEADVLIMAKSSFSYVAGFLSDGLKLCEKYFYPPRRDWMVMHEFELDERQLRQLDGIKPKEEKGD